MQKFSILTILLLLFFLVTILEARDERKDAVLVTGTVSHMVQVGETLYGISRHYQVTVDGLLYANKFLNKDFVIHPGDKLMIPDNESVERLAAIKPNCLVIKCKYHIVQQGETLYGISKKYDGLTVGRLLELNELISDALQPGQEIIVEVLGEQITAPTEVKESNDHWTRAKERMQKEEHIAQNESVQQVVEIESSGEEVSSQKFNSVADVIQHYKAIFDSYNSEELTERKEKCVANYLDEEMGNSSYFALYNDAEVGAVLKVRNLMNNNIVYLRVVGSVPELDFDNSVNLKISNSAAKKLNVLDEKFQAEVVSFAR